MMTLEQTLRAYRGYAPTYDLVFGPVLHDGRRMAVQLANGPAEPASARGRRRHGPVATAFSLRCDRDRDRCLA
ncbi:MAG: hypothetical protein WDN69_15815 [Aliidongia sp.]